MSELPSEVSSTLERIRGWDADAADQLTDVLTRILRAADALAWARDRIGRLAAAIDEASLLDAVVDEARSLTGVPMAWALTWSRRGDHIRFESLAGSGARTADGAVVGPDSVSRSVLGRVVEDGRPAWSDDAVADARFMGAESVQALALRSVGCLPLGQRGALYLCDPDTPARFSATDRARLSALCTLAGELLPAEEPKRRRSGSNVEPLPGVVGEAPSMAELARTVRAFAPMPWPVLILGETGTGKEAVARAIHELSGVRGPFVPVNCGAIPENLAESTLFGHERGAFTGADRRQEGLVENAHGGTLFLDEVGELAAPVQAKLLRLLQEGTFRRLGDERERRFGGRVLAATHRNVDETAGDFREDLFHRLSACVVRVPALRERASDIGPLAEHLLARALTEVPGSPRLRLGPDAESALRSRPWSGNVRELQNVLKGAAARAISEGADIVGAAHLPQARSATKTSGNSWPSDLLAATERFQQARVRDALADCSDNKTQAAEHLGVSRQWLHRLISRWDREGPW